MEQLDDLKSDLENNEDNEEECQIETAVNYRKMILMNMLSCVNAEEYMPIFEQHNITHETLRLLEEDDLHVMGITDKQHVLELLNYIRSLPPLHRRNYDSLNEPLLNKDVILNLSKHVDLLTLALKQGMDVSCCINDINCRNPDYSGIQNPIIYPEGVKSSEIATDTIKYMEKKIDELILELENSKELWSLKEVSNKKFNVNTKLKNIYPCMGIVALTLVSCFLLKKLIK